MVSAPLVAPAVCAAPARPSRPAERAWVERSVALADAARRNVSVVDFRRDIVAHRERLRAIVAGQTGAPASVVQLHRSMVLINALLHAAAECHSGGRIVCPADLLQHIDEQLQTGLAQLRALEGGAAPRKRV